MMTILTPKLFDHKSYGGVAHVVNRSRLYSYGNLVCEIEDNVPTLYNTHLFYPSTMKHIRDFIHQYGNDIPDVGKSHKRLLLSRYADGGEFKNRLYDSMHVVLLQDRWRSTRWDWQFQSCELAEAQNQANMISAQATDRNVRISKRRVYHTIENKSVTEMRKMERYAQISDMSNMDKSLRERHVYFRNALGCMGFKHISVEHHYFARMPKLLIVEYTQSRSRHVILVDVSGERIMLKFHKSEDAGYGKLIKTEPLCVCSYESMDDMDEFLSCIYTTISGNIE